MRFLLFMNTPHGRWIRVGLGLALIVIGATIGGPIGIVVALFAALPIATGVFGVCPINPLFGTPMKACSLPKQRPSSPVV